MNKVLSDLIVTLVDYCHKLEAGLLEGKPVVFIRLSAKSGQNLHKHSDHERVPYVSVARKRPCFGRVDFKLKANRWLQTSRGRRGQGREYMIIQTWTYNASRLF